MELEKDKVYVTDSKMVVTGKINDKIFECEITQGQYGFNIEIVNSELFTQEEGNKILDRMELDTQSN